MLRATLLTALTLWLVPLAIVPGPAVAKHRAYTVLHPLPPRPMPSIIHRVCPGLDSQGCFVAAGNADYGGTPWPHGAVFTNGDRFVTAHELGHAFDATMLDRTERTRFLRLVRTYPLNTAWVSTYVDEEGRLIDAGWSPAEVFADAYASCWIGQIIAENHEWTTSSGYQPSAHIERLVCRMIRRAGHTVGTPLSADGYR
jgi:hypothetical protein